MEDLSALIFVALAVAWASYLIPKALQVHDDGRRGRTVDSFSDGMRVLASREPVSARDARLVVGASGRRPAEESVSARPAPAEGSVPAPGRVAARDRGGRTTRRAARRRRRVLGILLLALIAVAAGAAYGLLEWFYLAIPGGLLAGWLVACRLMARRERRTTRTRRGAEPRLAASQETARAGTVAEGSTAGAPVEPEPVSEPVVPDEIAVARNDQGFEEVAAVAITSSIPVAAGVAASGLWDPVPVTLPTYVTKAPAARRTVRTIDLDASGVWTSGRTEVASALARQAEAEAAEAAAAASAAASAAADGRHAVG